MPRDVEPRRALVLQDRPLVVDLIVLTLNHAVRTASSLAEAEAILAEYRRRAEATWPAPSGHIADTSVMTT